MTTADPALDTPIAHYIWQTRYRAEGEVTVADTWRRVAHSLAAVEPEDPAGWEQRFYDVLRDFQFLPGGRILAGAGTIHDVTLLNCFVMGTIEDSIPGIFRALQEGAVTMQHGGGVGYDFSTLRPRGLRARTTGAIASGPLSFMDVWDAMCATIQSTGVRRGAMMATLRCDHPDVGAFIDAKRDPARLRHFNLSVQVTDAFMRAVEQDDAWHLAFPVGTATQVVQARALWDRLLHASYESSEPGVLFIDQINRMNNLYYCEQISACNPCGEVPLPPYGACDLGAINLPALVRHAFTPHAQLDLERLEHIVPIAVRMLDNVIELSRFPMPEQQYVVRQTRRIGLGITGLADALIMLGLRYDLAMARALAGGILRTMCHAAYRQSIALSKQKGSFPAFDRERYLDGLFVRTLPEDIRDGIARSGARNSHLLAIAPTGTISLLAGNLSSGLEPVFAADQERTVLDAADVPRQFHLTDHAVRLWRVHHGRPDGHPDALVTAQELSIDAHLSMQAELQRYVDNSISKTINVPAETSFAAFASLYRLAYDKGVKGCTTFRASVGRGTVLTGSPPTEMASCGIRRCE